MNRLISLLLVFSLLIAQWPASAFAWEGDAYQDDMVPDALSYDAACDDGADYAGEYHDSFFDNETDGGDGYDPYDAESWEEWSDEKLYEAECFRYGYILIWNYEQLINVGSGLTVTSLDQDEASFGLGETVWADAETPLTYAPDADYMLACDILFPDRWLWTLPENFTGSFTSWKSLADPSWSIAKECPLLYDAEYDTVYLYHAAQLDALLSETGANRAVCAQDYDLHSFGTGETVCPAGADSVTYSTDHHYVLSALFSYDPLEEEVRASYKTEQTEPEEELPDWDEEENTFQEYPDEFPDENDPSLEKPESADPEQQKGTEQDGTGITGPGGETEPNQEPAESTDPETKENAAPESTESTDPETKEDTAPETTASTDPETKENAAPESTESTDPETKEDAAPESTESTDPETKEDAAPESTESTDPEMKEDAAPESTGSTDPETKEDTAPESTDPETKIDADSAGKENTDSEKKADSAPENAENTEPEKPEKAAQDPAEKTENNTNQEAAAAQRENLPVKMPETKAWQYGYIFLYHFAQLKAVGSATAITSLDHEADTFGLGGEILTEDGTPAVYAEDGCYVLACDIPFPDGETWVLPEGFKGKFVPLDEATAAVTAAAAAAAAAEQAKAASAKSAVSAEKPEDAPEINDGQDAFLEAEVPEEFQPESSMTGDGSAVPEPEAPFADAGTDGDVYGGENVTAENPADEASAADDAWEANALSDMAAFDAPYDDGGDEPADPLTDDWAESGLRESGFENMDVQDLPGEEADNGSGEDFSAPGTEETSDTEESADPEPEQNREEAGEEDPAEPDGQNEDGADALPGDTIGETYPEDEKSEPADADEKTPRLYDEESDTIYLYQPWQLITLQAKNRDEQPVLSQDYDAAKFGTGKFLYLGGENSAAEENEDAADFAGGEEAAPQESAPETERTYLTYSGGHHYVLSAGFSAEQTEPAEKLCEAKAYHSGYVFIHHFDQLAEIASGHVITTDDHLAGEIGRGNAVWADKDTLAVYAPDANYVLMSDIPFPDGETWVLPENFAGRFVLRAEAEKQLPVYADSVGTAEESAAGDAAAQESGEPALRALFVPEEVPEEGTKDATKASPEELPLILSDDALFDAPEGGTKDAANGEEAASAPKLYDKDSDTLYLYHPYQLMVLRTADREEQPVMSMDYDMASFGMGKFIFPEGEEEAADENAAQTDDPTEELHLTDNATFKAAEDSFGGTGTAEGDETTEEGQPAGEKKSNYLTYSETHHYVLSESFTTTMLMRAKRAPLRATSSINPAYHVDGRDFFGQTSVEIGGTTYILIGDRQQLDAINSDEAIRKNVCTPVFYIEERAIQVRRTGVSNWIWLSEFKNSDTLLDGNGYGTTAAEVMASYQNLASGAQIIYPGDADLVEDFSTSPLYDVDNSGYHKLDRPAGTATVTNKSREIYFTVDQNTGYPVINSTAISSDPHDGTLRYTKDGNYIVFRNIDMSIGYNVTQTNGRGDWKPLMFTGTMYGVKSAAATDVSTLWDSGKTAMNLDTGRKPEISNVNVVAVVNSNNFLDLGVQEGVGFFGTITSNINDSSYNETRAVVRNLKLKNGIVTNNAVYSKDNENLVHILLDGVLGPVLQGLVDTLLRALTGKNVNITLQQLLDTRRGDPNNLATGAFAGQIIGQTTVEDCVVENFAVNTVSTYFETGNDTIVVNTENGGMIVGKGGFVGHVEGVAAYSGLSSALNGVTSVLENLLNAVPGLGLGDLITLLLRNVLAVSFLTPTGYNAPEVRNCTVSTTTLSTETGKFGVGGFAGSVVGTRIESCAVADCDGMTVNADLYGGGFAGVVRDSIISTTLSGLNIIISQGLYPNAELVNCSISDSSMTVEGGSGLGGFAGILSNSYAFNDTIDASSAVTVRSVREAYGETLHQQDFVGGFVGETALGSGLTFGDHLQSGADLLSTLTGLLVDVLKDPNTSASASSALLDVAGVAPSAVMGCQVLAPVSVTTPGSFAGGFVGHGEGTLITSSNESYIRKLHKYESAALPVSTAQDNLVSSLASVAAENNYAGGIAGYLTTANAGGLLGETAGVAQFLGFTVCDTDINGIPEGYTVTAGRYYAGGGIGWAVGGDIYDVELTNLKSVTAENYAGGFAGATGPGDLLDGGGLHLTLLGLDVISAQNLLSVGEGVRTIYTRANVTGIDDGFTVEETGKKADIAEANYDAGGYAAQANSVTIRDCHVEKLLSVTANMQDGVAGGFVGESAAGGLASLLDDSNTDLLHALTVNGLLGAVPYMIPKFEGNSVSYVDGGFVMGDTAGGYAGDFQSGFVNRETLDVGGEYETGHFYSKGTETEPWSVYNIDHVWGGRYGGGWGGKVYSGALASAGGGISLLSSSGNNAGALAISDLLTLLNDYVPIIKYAGVFNETNGYTVYAAHDFEAPLMPAADGYAGGFIGYGSGVQVSYSNVFKLRHGEPTEPDSFTGEDIAAYTRFGIWPDALESQNGGNYMRFNNGPDATPYAVAGARYAGGYIGHMDIGSAATLGGALSLLTVLDLGSVLSALDVVVSTIEHSNVTGCPGGFNVIASSHVNLTDGAYDSAGVSYAGGYAGKISGGHIQDGNVWLFGYIVGEIAAGGYAGEAVPGDAANVLGGDSSVLSSLIGVSGLASLVQDFVPTIRNSETTCIPCGGGIRAECPSDSLVKRGLAGGYIGHGKGVQIWGKSDDYWKSGTYPGPTRECAAIRIRSVYGAEYAGGYCGLLESGSTAETGGISLLGGLIQANNLLGVLEVVYPTIRYGTVYGPLENVDPATWTAWETYVGQYGSFYPEIARHDFNAYAYGTHVVAGRHRYDNTSNVVLSGCAGGFVGAMHSGVIRHCWAKDAKLVAAMRASGGFAGEVQTKDSAGLGSASILGLNLNLGNMVSLLKVFVPEISESGVDAYQQGLTVVADGSVTDSQVVPGVGMAGGYCGASYGGQLGLHNDNNIYKATPHNSQSKNRTLCIAANCR